MEKQSFFEPFLHKWVFLNHLKALPKTFYLKKPAKTSDLLDSCSIFVNFNSQKQLSPYYQPTQLDQRIRVMYILLINLPIF